MITLGEKIKDLIKQAGYKKPGAFYKEMHALHGQETISPKTYYNLLHDLTPPRDRTLFQAASILKTTVTELRKGTDQEIKHGADDKRTYLGQYSFNDRAHLYGYNIKAPFMTLKLHLKAGGQTSEERDSLTAKESVKEVLVIMGAMTVVIRKQTGEERHRLHKGQLTAFDARDNHYFINESRTNSIAYIIHYQAENSALYLP